MYICFRTCVFVYLQFKNILALLLNSERTLFFKYFLFLYSTFLFLFSSSFLTSKEDRDSPPPSNGHLIRLCSFILPISPSVSSFLLLFSFSFTFLRLFHFCYLFFFLVSFLFIFLPFFLNANHDQVSKTFILVLMVIRTEFPNPLKEIKKKNLRFNTLLVLVHIYLVES